MLEFLSANYILIIVLSVVIIMVIVGYFADKNQSKENKPKLKDRVDELENTNNESDNVQIDEWEDKPLPKEEDDVIEVKGMDDSFDSWDDNMATDEPKEESTEEVANEEIPVEESNEEIPVEEISEEPKEENIEESSLEEPANNEEPIPFPEVEESSNNETEETPVEQPVQEEVSEEPAKEESVEEANPIEDLEITLPNIDTLNEEIKDVVDAEDVWKF